MSAREPRLPVFRGDVDAEVVEGKPVPQPCPHGGVNWLCRDCRRTYAREYARKRRTTCKNGHPLIDPRTGERYGRGQRCIVCDPPREPVAQAPPKPEPTHCASGLHERTPENWRMYGHTVRCVPCHKITMKGEE